MEVVLGLTRPVGGVESEVLSSMDLTGALPQRAVERDAPNDAPNEHRIGSLESHCTD